MRRVLDHFGFRAATILGPKSDRMENIVYKKIKFKYPRAPTRRSAGTTKTLMNLSFLLEMC